MTFTLDDLNRMDQPAFTQALGWIFEHSPWVAERAWGARPFATCEALHQAMVAQVQHAAAAEQLALLRAHPDLGTRAKVSLVSTQEQAGVGLDRLSPEEYDLFTGMNQAYAAKFGFPFIMAVRGQTRAALLAALRTRLEREQAHEMAQALQEVYKIAWFRLADTVVIPEFSYGKGDVIVYRTQGKPLTGVRPIPESTFTGRSGAVMGWKVEVLVRGEAFLPAYSVGDNRAVVATDSMKNFILRQAAAYPGATLEGFLDFVGRQFLSTYPQMEAVALQAQELPFAHAQLPGGASDLLFARSQGAQATGSWSLARTADGVAVVDHAGGVQGLQLLKVSGNSFAGFVRDEYTTLPDAYDRSLLLFLDIAWIYTVAADALGETPERYVPAEQIRDLVQLIFHELQAGSIQHLLYHVGHRILERFPQLAEVSFTGQNRTWETVVEAGGVRVLTEPRPPYGIQQYRVRRYGAGE